MPDTMSSALDDLFYATADMVDVVLDQVDALHRAVDRLLEHGDLDTALVVLEVTKVILPPTEAAAALVDRLEG